MPAAAPAMPIARVSPMTWAVIWPLRQPSALRVPNSRTRRATAARVSKLATATAAQIETVPRPSWPSAAAMSASPSSARLRIASCKETSAVRYWAWVNPRAPAAPRNR